MTSHTKRIAGVAGLLAALTLTATGCQVAPNPNGAQAAPPVQEAPQVKLTDVEVTADSDYEGWNSMDGEVGFRWSEADKAAQQKNGKAILQVLFEDHPEFTVDGFKATSEVWKSEVAPKLQPLTLSSKWAMLTGAWSKEVPAEDGKIASEETEPYRNPVLTNRPEILNGDKYPAYTIQRSWKSKSGETCSPSDKPYDINVQAISITTRPEGNSFASAYPLLTPQLEIAIHCKEGGKLKAAVSPTIQMKKENGEWRLSGMSWFTGPGPFTGDIEE